MQKELVAFQLVKFLESRGVETIFGLCGHTVIGFLDALKEAKSDSSPSGTNRSPPMRRTDMPVAREDRSQGFS